MKFWGCDVLQSELPEAVRSNVKFWAVRSCKVGCRKIYIPAEFLRSVCSCNVVVNFPDLCNNLCDKFMTGDIFMSYIIRRKVKNAVYVYECTSYRNKDGKPRSKQKYLGKLDSDGILITKKRKLPVQIQEVKTITRKFILETVNSTKNKPFQKHTTLKKPQTLTENISHEFQAAPAGFSPDITSKKDTPIPTNSGSTGSPITAENIAPSGASTIDASTFPRLIRPFSASAHV